MDVATLGVEVTQKGVTATATALGKLAEQSVKVTTSVAALLKQIQCLYFGPRIVRVA